jgi:uncharacterized protein (TIGR00296 family)
MDFDLSQEEGEYLVRIARKTIENILKNKPKPDTSDATESLKLKAGAFVTLKSVKDNNSLRGCIGLPYPVKPLIEAVVEASYGAAFKDPRFSAVSSEEIGDLILEVSVLTPPQLIDKKKPLKTPKEIEIGKDGLIIIQGSKSGLLLPQVATELGWNSEEFLCHCCQKAWLPMDAWLHPNTKVMKFQSIIFKEETPRGNIKRVDLEG